MKVLFVLLLAVSLPLAEVSAADCLKIGIASGALSSVAVARITDRIFSRAGACAEIVSMPLNRLTALSENDFLDGEALKIADYVEQHPNLILVPTAVMHLTGNLYWPNGADEPKGPETTIGVTLGQIWPRRAAQERNASIFEVRNYDQMIEMTRSGRLQGFMMAGEAFAFLSPRYSFLTRYNSRAVADLPLHLVLNRRHEALSPLLDKAVQAILATGDIDREIKSADR